MRQLIADLKLTPATDEEVDVIELMLQPGVMEFTPDAMDAAKIAIGKLIGRIDALSSRLSVSLNVDIERAAAHMCAAGYDPKIPEPILHWAALPEERKAVYRRMAEAVARELGLEVRGE